MADTGERRSLHHCIAASNACRCFRKIADRTVFFCSQYVVLQRGNDSVAWKLKQDQGKCSACASANACSNASSSSSESSCAIVQVQVQGKVAQQGEREQKRMAAARAAEAGEAAECWLQQPPLCSESFFGQLWNNIGALSPSLG